MALAHPDRVNRLALLSPVLPDRPFEPTFFDNLRDVARVIRADGLEAAMLGPWMESPLWESSLKKPEVADRLREIVRTFPGAEYLATQRDRPNRDWTVADRLAEIFQPTLVIVGGREMPGFIAWAREIADGIPHATLEILEDMGHLHLLEDPRLVADLISQFTPLAE
jgi:3-oxoadipate enol-lactonase